MSVQMNLAPQNIKPNQFSQKTKNIAIKAHHFAQRQVRHAFIQGASFCALETNSPSPNWQVALIRKLSIDVGEAISLIPNNIKSGNSHSSSKLTTKYQATNSIAIISDLTKATINIGKKLLKKFRA